MYFSEFLETCTIRWVWICEGGVGVGKGNPENAFFILVGGDGTHRPHPGLRPYSPRVTPAHLDGCTVQAAAQAVPEPGQTMPTADSTRHTRPDAGHVAPGRSGRRRGWTARNVSGKVYNFGRLFLSIFIWIYFAESIDNPYIYMDII